MPPTKQVIFCQGVEDAGGSDEIAHCSRESWGIHSNNDKGIPDIDVAEKTVIPLKKQSVTVYRERKKKD